MLNIISKVVLERNIPGCVGAIVKSNNLKDIQSTGLRKYGCIDLLSANDKMHLGSNTKAITAILICQLVEKKKMTFDSNLVEIFPEFETIIHSSFRRLSVRHLLNHTAGLSPNLDWNFINSSMWRYTLQQQRLYVVEKALSDGPTVFQSVGTFQYSNVGYVILGAVVEKLTGKSWESVVQEEIFSPLGMDTGGFGCPAGDRGAVNQPWGHIAEVSTMTKVANFMSGIFGFNFTGADSASNEGFVCTNSPVRGDNPAMMAPAGGVHCSVVDWSKFIVKVLVLAKAALSERNNSPRSGNATVSSSGAVFEMGVSADTYRDCLHLTQPGQTFAGGWIITPRSWARGVTLSHAGSNTMWYSSAWVAPMIDTAYLVATNTGAEPVSVAVNDIVTAMIQLPSEEVV